MQHFAPSFRPDNPGSGPEFGDVEVAAMTMGDFKVTLLGTGVAHQQSQGITGSTPAHSDTATSSPF
jgi:hypothetical protein